MVRPDPPHSVFGEEFSSDITGDGPEVEHQSLAPLPPPTDADYQGFQLSSEEHMPAAAQCMANCLCEDLQATLALANTGKSWNLILTALRFHGKQLALGRPGLFTESAGRQLNVSPKLWKALRVSIRAHSNASAARVPARPGGPVFRLVQTRADPRVVDHGKQFSSDSESDGPSYKVSAVAHKVVMDNRCASACAGDTTQAVTTDPYDFHGLRARDYTEPLHDAMFATLPAISITKVITRGLTTCTHSVAPPHRTSVSNLPTVACTPKGPDATRPMNAGAESGNACRRIPRGKNRARG